MDQEGADDCHVAEPGEFFAQLSVSCDRAKTCLAADDKFADHNGETDEDTQCKINEQKCESAVSAYLVREAPNVAQTDSRTDGGHDKAEIGAKRVAIVFHSFLSFNNSAFADNHFIC